jgi:hypothetical protein
MTFQSKPFSQSPEGGVFVLFYLAIAAGTLLSAVLALALLREVRLRRALEALLRRILTAWRKMHESNESDTPRPRAPNPDSDDRL